MDRESEHLAGRKEDRVCAASDYQRRHGRDQSHGFVRENKNADEDVDQGAGNGMVTGGSRDLVHGERHGIEPVAACSDAGRARGSDCGGAGEMILYDTAKGGRALLTESSERVELASVSTVEAGGRGVGWLCRCPFAAPAPPRRTALRTGRGSRGRAAASVCLGTPLGLAPTPPR